MKHKAVYSELLPIVTGYFIELSSDEALYQAFIDIQAQDSTLSFNQERVLTEAINDFKLSGVDLGGDDKATYKEISLRLSELSKDFTQHLIDANNSYELIITDKEAVKELPEADLKAATITKDGKCVYRFTLHMPSYIAYMTYGSDRQYREQLYKAYTTRAAQNGALIDEILRLREQKANLLGFDSYAQYSIAKKDAPSVEAVEQFLITMADKASILAKQELQALEEFAHCKLEAYDVAYFAEKLKKEQYHIDEEVYRQYFEKNSVVAYIFAFLERLFQVGYTVG